MHSAIAGIEYYLPEAKVTTADLAAQFPEWSIDKIAAKTGIYERRIAAERECASDLAFAAATKLFESGACSPDEIDYVLLCTQSPDYVLPTTACLLQHRLGIPTSAGALDFNLGCSGFVYGLGLAEGLISSAQAHRILLITAETYSRFMSPYDKSVRSVFGDGAAATFLEARSSAATIIGPFIYGTDGRGGPNLMVPAGGARIRCSEETRAEVDDKCGNRRSKQHLFMNGPCVLEFTLDTVPVAVEALLRKAAVASEEVDLFVFHQANAYMLEELRSIIGIPRSKFQIAMSHCGNTVSSTIPIALRHAVGEGRLKPGMLVMVVGFGVGYSWSAALIRWTGLRCLGVELPRGETQDDLRIS